MADMQSTHITRAAWLGECTVNWAVSTQGGGPQVVFKCTAIPPYLTLLALETSFSLPWQHIFWGHSHNIYLK